MCDGRMAYARLTGTITRLRTRSTTSSKTDAFFGVRVTEVRYRRGL
jgi:hypothetical protein